MTNNVFNPNVNIASPKSEGNGTQFRPNTSRARDKKKYTAIVRFLPHPFDTQNKTVIAKSRIYLKNPIQNKSMYIDCPSSVGLPDPLTEYYFSLKKSENQFKQLAADNFSRKLTYTSLVQVLQCDDEPSLVNKILTWTYGIKVYQKIEKEMRPEIGAPRNPFDLINGRVFVVVAVQVDKFQNFDQSYFADLEKPNNAVRVKAAQPDANGKDVYLPITEAMIADEASRNYIVKFLQDTCPDTKPYEYQPWTDEISRFVEESYQAYCNPQSIAAMAQAHAQQAAIPLNGGIAMPGVAMPGMMPAGAPVMPSAAPQQQYQQTIQPQPQAPAGAPAQVAMGMQALGNLTAPAGQQMQQHQPQAPAGMPLMGGTATDVAPQAPQMGLGLPGQQPQQAPAPAVDPVADLGSLGADINSLIGGNAAQQPTPQQTAAQQAVNNAQNFDDIMKAIF